MRKNTKLLLAAVSAVAMMVLTACGGSGDSQSTTAAASAETVAQTDETKEAGDTADDNTKAAPAKAASADFDGKLHGPFIMTTCGQSTGSVMMHMLAMQEGIDSVDDHSLSVETFDPGDAVTLVVTTGTSGKGMGAAGTDVNDEINRCVALIDEARKDGMTIVCAHIEGASRRTDSSDQASIDAIMPLADVIVVIEESDSDGLFSDYATEHDVPIIITKDALDIAEYME